MNETNGAGNHRLVQLRFKPLWLYVDTVREFCDFFARATFEDEAVGQRVGLIVHELLENAVRYGDEKDLEIRLEQSNDGIVISVENTTTDDRARKLRAVFDELTTQTPVAAYHRALEQARSLPATESGLGLPRVRYEGQVELQLETSPGRVSITARGNP